MNRIHFQLMYHYDYDSYLLNNPLMHICIHRKFDRLIKFIELQHQQFYIDQKYAIQNYKYAMQHTKHIWRHPYKQNNSISRNILTGNKLRCVCNSVMQDIPIKVFPHIRNLTQNNFKHKARRSWWSTHLAAWCVSFILHSNKLFLTAGSELISERGEKTVYGNMYFLFLFHLKTEASVRDVSTAHHRKRVSITLNVELKSLNFKCVYAPRHQLSSVKRSANHIVKPRMHGHRLPKNSTRNGKHLPDLYFHISGGIKHLWERKPKLLM